MSLREQAMRELGNRFHLKYYTFSFCKTIVSNCWQLLCRSLARKSGYETMDVIDLGLVVLFSPSVRQVVYCTAMYDTTYG
jgi:hypothetical protein